MTVCCLNNAMIIRFIDYMQGDKMLRHAVGLFGVTDISPRADVSQHTWFVVWKGEVPSSYVNSRYVIEVAYKEALAGGGGGG